MTTRKTIALTLRTSVIKVMSLVFNTLSKFVIAFILLEAETHKCNRAKITWKIVAEHCILDGVVSTSRVL